MDFCTSIGQVYAWRARRPMQNQTRPASFEVSKILFQHQKSTLLGAFYFVKLEFIGIIRNAEFVIKIVGHSEE